MDTGMCSKLAVVVVDVLIIMPVAHRSSHHCHTAEVGFRSAG